MKTFSGKGIQFDYPDNLRITGSWPQISAARPDCVPNFQFGITLLRAEESFKSYYLRELDPVKLTEDFSRFVAPEFRRFLDRNERVEAEIIRAGDLSSFSKAKELYFMQTDSSGSRLEWRVLISAGSRLILVQLSLPANEADEIESIWAPLIKSLRFDPKALEAIGSNDAPIKHGWRKPSPKPKQTRHEFFAEFNYAVLFDSRARLFYEEDGDSSADLENIQESLREAGFFKRKKSLFLGQKFMPRPDLFIDFFLNANPPADDSLDWARIIEWGLDLNSGKLCFTCDEEPELEFLLPNGPYKIRICLGGQFKGEESKSYADHDLWRIDIISTPEKADNEARIIK